MNKDVRVAEKSETKFGRSAAHFLVAVLWAFLLIYQPPFRGLTIYGLTGIAVLYLFIHIFSTGKISIDLMYPFFMLGLAFVYLVIVNLLNVKPISEISNYFWLLVCILPSTYSFSCFLSKEKRSFDYLFHVLLVASLIQTSIALVALFSSDFHEDLFDLMIENGLYSEKHIELWGYRIYGYGTSLMYSIPLSQGIIAGISVIYGIEKFRVRYFFAGFLILISGIINAKISAVAFLVVIIVGILFAKKDSLKKSFFTLLSFVFGGAILNFVLLYLEKTQTKLLDWMSILLDAARIEEYYEGYYGDYDKWTLPEGPQFLFGTGAGVSYYGRDVDMGMVNDIWVGGIVFFIFTVVIAFYLANRIFTSEHYSKTWQRVLPVSFVLIFFIANVKGNVFSYSSFMSLYFIVAMYSSYFPKVKTI